MVATGTRIGIGPSLFSLGCLWFVGWHPHCRAEQYYNILRISWSGNVGPFWSFDKRDPSICFHICNEGRNIDQSVKFCYGLALSIFSSHPFCSKLCVPPLFSLWGERFPLKIQNIGGVKGYLIWFYVFTTCLGHKIRHRLFLVYRCLKHVALNK